MCALYFPKATLDVFAMRQAAVYLAAKTNSDEVIAHVKLSDLSTTVENVPQLIQLCVQYFKGCTNEEQ